MAAPQGNSFKLLPDGSYGVAVRGMKAKKGDTVTVSKKDGSTQDVVLGEFVEENKWKDLIFRRADTK